MNLYFRLLLILLRSRFAAHIKVLDESRIGFRVWPFDMDINMHLTNARYFSLCDLSRIYYLGQVGILFDMLRRRWLPIAQAQEISYFRPINPFQRFTVTTRFSWWDDKYWYTEHHFHSRQTLCAVLQVRGVIVQGKTIVSMHDVVALTGEAVTVPDKPANVAYWQQLLEAKKSTAEPAAE